MRHVTIAVSLLRHHEVAATIKRRLDCGVRRNVEIPVGLGIVARSIGIRRIDRDKLTGWRVSCFYRNSRGRADGKPALHCITCIAVPVHLAPRARAGADRNLRARRHGEKQLGIGARPLTEAKFCGSGPNPRQCYAPANHERKKRECYGG
jgi:hypothetical protein